MVRKKLEWDRNFSLNGDSRRKRRRKTSYRNRDRVRVEDICLKRYSGDRDHRRKRNILVVESERSPHFDLIKKTSKVVEWKVRFNPGDWLIVLVADKTRHGQWILRAHLYFRKLCGQYRRIEKRVHRMKREMLTDEELEQVDEFTSSHEPVLVGRPF